MAEDKRSLLQRFIIWREKNIKEKRFILILSFLVGIFTAFAALILKVIIHWIQNFLTDNFNATEANYLYLVYPVVGIFLTGLFVRYVVKDDISHGVTKILYAISRRQGRIKRHNTWSSIIASSITIGFGGSVGAEAPIVLTGSAIGSNLGTIFKMEHRTLMLLVGCGAAGAVAGIFKAPIAGLVFTLEVLMIDLTMSSLLPLLISAVFERFCLADVDDLVLFIPNDVHPGQKRQHLCLFVQFCLGQRLTLPVACLKRLSCAAPAPLMHRAP